MVSLETLTYKNIMYMEYIKMRGGGPLSSTPTSSFPPKTESNAGSCKSYGCSTPELGEQDAGLSS